jgi:methylmalonyl-CoA/ethylmalonyl-CoA epimerase
LPDVRRHPPQDLTTHGHMHVAFRVENLDSFLLEMAEKHAKIALVVRETFGKSCFVRDCAGNLIEFFEEDIS